MENEDTLKTLYSDNNVLREQYNTLYNTMEQIETKIHNLTETVKGNIHISTHPFVASYINEKDGWFSSSICGQWGKKFDRKVIITADERLHLLQYSVVK